MAERAGFFQEESGARSMTRLLAFLAGLGGFLILLACIVVAIRDGEHAPGIIAALAAAALPAFGGAWAALRERTTDGA